jgi:hypothetical protein
MKISDEEIKRAKNTDPTPLLQSYGYRVIWEGKHGYISFDDRKVFRITKCDDGHFVTCPNNGIDKIGDNIALVRYIDARVTFRGAVEVLLSDSLINGTHAHHGGSGIKNNVTEAKQAVEYPILSFGTETDVLEGRRYLMEERGISFAILLAAETEGAVRYVRDYVAFCGYDVEGNIRNIALRATSQQVAKAYTKWNVKNSDKGYPVIFGGDTEVVWIVEGGVDGLAVRNLYAVKDIKPPTAIVSGGALVLSYLDNERVQSVIRGARVVWLAREREKDEGTQKQVERGFLKMKAKVEGILNGDAGKVKVWEPPEGVKDLGEMNFKRD